MRATQARFLDLLGADRTQFIIPVYQREYSWERPQLEDLWNDVTLAGKDGMTHFIGSFLYIPEEDSTATSIHRKLLIDGQQRMTTLSLLLAALLDYLDEDDSRAQFLTDLSPKSLRKSYLFNDDYRGESRYKLVLSMDDKATMQSLVDGTKLPQSPIRRLVEAKAFFTDNIRSGRVSPETLWNGLNKLVIIDTELNPNEDNAQLIFESMNSKGKRPTHLRVDEFQRQAPHPNRPRTQLHSPVTASRPAEGALRPVLEPYRTPVRTGCRVRIQRISLVLAVFEDPRAQP